MVEAMATTDVLRVLLIDEKVLIRKSLRRLIEDQPDIDVVDDIGMDGSVVQWVSQYQPDVMVIDFDHDHSRATLAQLQRVTNGVRILGLTKTITVALAQEAVHLGVHGLFSTTEVPRSFLMAIRKVAEGEVWLPRAIVAALFQALSQPPPPESEEERNIKSVTDREHEVITLLCVGLKNEAIADRLHISPSTVRHHLTSIYSKLQVNDRLELLIFAYRHGLVDPPTREVGGSNSKPFRLPDAAWSPNESGAPKRLVGKVKRPTDAA